jgi:hypothetical protein
MNYVERLTKDKTFNYETYKQHLFNVLKDFYNTEFVAKSKSVPYPEMARFVAQVNRLYISIQQAVNEHYKLPILTIDGFIRCLELQSPALHKVYIDETKPVEFINTELDNSNFKRKLKKI